METNQTSPKRRERFPPPPNLPPADTWYGWGLFLARQWADLQVASVLQHLKPWLASRAGDLLEVGCGAQPYRHFVPDACTYCGLEWQGSEEHFGYKAPDTSYYSGGRFPFDDSAFDAVFLTEVLEHVYDTVPFLQECCRVLKPDGELFLAVPFQARYHYIPYDFWRFTPASLERRLGEAGFEGITVAARGTDLTVAAYKILSVLYRWFSGGGVGRIAAFLMSPLGVITLAIGHATLRVPLGSDDDCLGFVAKARRPREIIDNRPPPP